MKNFQLSRFVQTILFFTLFAGCEAFYVLNSSLIGDMLSLVYHVTTLSMLAVLVCCVSAIMAKNEGESVKVLNIATATSRLAAVILTVVAQNLVYNKLESLKDVSMPSKILFITTVGISVILLVYALFGAYDIFTGTGKPVKKMSSNEIKKLTISAIMLAYAVVINIFTVVVTIAGVNALEIRFGSVFIRFVAVMFGGIYGGIVGGLSDVISFLVKPLGPYMWEITVVEILRSFFVGLIWFKIKKINLTVFNIGYIMFFGLCTIIGAAAIILNNSGAAFMENIEAYLGSIKTISICLLSVGIVGLAAVVPAFMIGKKRNDSDEYFGRLLKIIAVTIIPCLAATTANTFVLRNYYVNLAERPFVALWIGRITKEIILILLNAYILAEFLKLYEKAFKKGVKAV